MGQLRILLEQANSIRSGQRRFFRLRRASTAVSIVTRRQQLGAAVAAEFRTRRMCLASARGARD